MPKSKAITPVHSAHLRRFWPELKKLEREPNQNSPAVNDKKYNFFANGARSLVCAFDWPDTLKNVVPRAGSDWDYKHIPELPELNEAQTLARAEDLKKLTAQVRRYYGDLRRAEQDGGGLAFEIQKQHVDRIMKAMAPPPKMERALDRYQSMHAERYKAKFDAHHQELMDAASDDEKKAELGRERAGALRHWAAEAWRKEKEDFKQELRRDIRKDHEKALAKYNSLFGNPDQCLNNSRAWVDEEIGSFLQIFLDWFSARYGVAMTLLVAGQKDSGRADCTTVCASGERRPNSRALVDFLGTTLRDAKIEMRKYAQSVLTGECAKGFAEKSLGEDGGEDDDVWREDLYKIDDEDGEDFSGALYKIDDTEENDFMDDAPGTTTRTSGGGNIAGPSRVTGTGARPTPTPRQRSRSRSRSRTATRTSAVRGGKDTRSPSRSTAVFGRRFTHSRDGTRSTSRGQSQAPARPAAHRQTTLAFARSGTADAGDVRVGGMREAQRARETQQWASATHHNSFAVFPTPHSRTGTVEPEEQGFGGDYMLWPHDIRHSDGEEDEAGSFAGGAWRAQSESMASEEGLSVADRRSKSMSLPPETDDDGLSAESIHKSLFADRSRRKSANKRPAPKSGSQSEAAEDIEPDVEADYAEWRKQKREERRAKEAKRAAASTGGARVQQGSGVASAKTRGKDKDTDKGNGKDVEKKKSAEKRKDGKGADKGKESQADTIVGQEIGRGRVRSRSTRSDSSLEKVVQAPTARPRKKRRAAIESEEEEEDAARVSPEAPSVGEVQTTATTAGTRGQSNKDASQAAGELLRNTGSAGTSDGFGMTWMKGRTSERDAASGAAWEWYVSKGKREAITNAMQLLGREEEQRTYADLVRTMEDLLVREHSWDPTGSAQLPHAGRPKVVGKMVKARGAMVERKDVSPTFGRELADWWLTLQPAERGSATEISALHAPTASMNWTIFSNAQGYKGSFLVVWCLMHWILYDEDREHFLSVARDMCAVFQVLKGLKREGIVSKTGRTSGRGDGGEQAGEPVRRGVRSRAVAR